MDTRAVKLDRRLLGEFLKSPETIKAFENLALNSDDLATTISAIQLASVLTLTGEQVFGNSRALETDGEVIGTDGGAGGSYTLGLSDTGVAADDYGDASSTLQIAVNEKGRITLAQAIQLVTDNIIEGVANLYFTQERARESISAEAPVLYDSGTGSISMDYLEGDYIPAVTSGTGTLTSASATGCYTKIGRQVTVSADITITTNGTGASWVDFTLPVMNDAAFLYVGVGRSTAGLPLQVFCNPSSGKGTILTAANAYPGGDGAHLFAQMTYFV